MTESQQSSDSLAHYQTHSTPLTDLLYRTLLSAYNILVQTAQKHSSSVAVQCCFRVYWGSNVVAIQESPSNCRYFQSHYLAAAVV